MGTWTLLLAALGLALLIEGLPYFVAPRAVRRYLGTVQRMQDGSLRSLGFFLMALGLLVAWLALSRSD